MAPNVLGQSRPRPIAPRRPAPIRALSRKPSPFSDEPSPFFDPRRPADLSRVDGPAPFGTGPHEGRDRCRAGGNPAG